VFLKGIALSLGKLLAVLAAFAALASRFTSCLIIVYQPKMPQKVRTLKGAGSIINHT
jgi:cyclic lactone autoinducer peptide